MSDAAHQRTGCLPVAVGGARVWFTTRTEGNLGLHVGDDPAAVRRHRDQLASLVGARPWFLDQVHGAESVIRSEPPAAGADFAGTADAIILDGRRGAAVCGARYGGSGEETQDDVGGQDDGLAGAVMVADCCPVVIASTDGRLAAAVHAGRAGLLAGVIEATVARLVALEPALAAPGAVHAALGPAICGRCYEVGEDVSAQVADTLPAADTTTRWGTSGVDLWAGVREVFATDPQGILQRAGVAPGTIRLDESWARCTYESADLYSYRRATHEGSRQTGRFAAVVRVVV